MSKKRGLSLDEKRRVLLSIFHEDPQPYMLKDVEKVASKRGVVLQSVKEVLQSLVDDDLVHSEKIGISIYFWSFPSEAAVQLTNRLQKAERTAEEKQRQREALEAEVEASKQGKEASEERSEKLAILSALETRLVEQQTELGQYADCDPERFKQIKAATIVARSAANRWLDNIECLRSWLNKRMEGQKEQLDSFFTELGYTDSMEYL